MNIRRLRYLAIAIAVIGLRDGISQAADPVQPSCEARVESPPAQPARGPISTWLHKHFFGDEAPDPGFANREETRRFICCSSDDFFAGNWRRPSPLPSDQPPH